MKIAMMGLGGIAHAVAPTLVHLQDAECYAVASRSKEKAEAFAEKYGFEKAYGSYEEMVEDPEVELVYIGTPHSHHYENMMLCLTHGKPVLCEKAFTMNADQAQRVADYAKEHGIYAAEAIWPRYMPSRTLIRETIDSGIIGTPRTMTANLCYVIAQNARIVDPNLAGGALLDVGVYGVNFALSCFGRDPERIESSVQFTPTGVDGNESITLYYGDGKMAVLTHGIYTRSDRKGIIHGDKGYIVVENINNPNAIRVYDTADRLVKTVEIPAQFSGYEYEFEEAFRCIREGKYQSDSMPLEESVQMMKVMDRVRGIWGLVYPQEKA